MLSRANIICCILSILLVGYLVVALITSSSMSMAATAPAKMPVKISVAGEDSTSFVTRREIAVIVKDYFTGNTITPSAIPTLDIENTLNSIDNIENARCTRRSNDRLWIEVTPMIPVARVFDNHGSYYINREGKRLTASLKYRCDVPVITGKLEERHSATRLMSLLDYITTDKSRAELVTALELKPNGDVILIPPFRGHVINFGDPETDIANKFDRLTTMYRDILPAKGWDYYDTLSVKFRGQVVASRRKPRQRDPLLILDPDGDASDNEDISTMTVDNN
ncbi:MAG: cell division protein FtsQ/DivIB [Muribaculaceae bacterium]|nr:cell division protein FtsQ/DivIB [Muribaculaceae bacterium]